MSARPLDVALVVGEESGDQLGFKLMRALRAQTGGAVSFRGVGGRRMAQEGLASLFPLEDVAVMGITAVIPRLPAIVRRVRMVVAELTARPPDVLVIVDSPDFTHAVARRLRRRRPEVAIVDYVSPSVWAWRPGRARRMRAYVDHLMALLPFEPGVHDRLGGPPTTYVGHPLVERLDELRPGPEEAEARTSPPGELLVMPGSRRSVVGRMLPVFRDTVARVAAAVPGLRVTVPVAPAVADLLAQELPRWPVPVRAVAGEAEKLAAFRRARAALVCSGTSTLELALSGVPMAVGYRLAPVEARLMWLVKVPSIVLPNLILGRNAIPEFVHGPCTPEALAPAVAALLADGPERQAQLLALAEIEGLMRLEDGETPSEKAARIVIDAARRT